MSLGKSSNLYAACVLPNATTHRYLPAPATFGQEHVTSVCHQSGAEVVKKSGDKQRQLAPSRKGAEGEKKQMSEMDDEPTMCMKTHASVIDINILSMFFRQFWHRGSPLCMSK